MVDLQVRIHSVNIRICLEVGKESFSYVVGRGFETLK